MKILSIDTSGQQATAAIINDYIIIGEITLNAKTGEKSWTHSEILMPGVEALFKLTAMDINEMDYIAYGAGPGSFTGLRIGASTALGLANGINKPTIAVPTLDLLAYNMLGAKSLGLVVPMLDARRAQVYAAIYQTSATGQLAATTSYMALPVEELLAMVDSQMTQDQTLQQNSPAPVFLGDGADAYQENIRAKIPQAIFVAPNNNRQRGASLALCALEKIKNGYQAPKEVEMLYVRAPQAVQDKINKEMKAATDNERKENERK